MTFKDVGRPKAQPTTPAAEPDERDTQFVKWGVELERSLAETVAGVLVRGARPVAVGGTPGATKRVSTSPGALVGFALTNEAVNATTRVLFHDGRDSDAAVIMTVALTPDESVRDWFYPGINLVDGLFVDADGPISGSVFMRGSE